MIMTDIFPTHSTPVSPSTGTLQPLGTDEVAITGGFWAQRQQTNASATLGHIKKYLESEGWLANFDLVAAGRSSEGHHGREFADSEIYKYLEAAAWELGRHHDERLEDDFVATVNRVAAAQEADGYIQTNFGHEGQAPRWSDLEWGHELYCMGHLFQAAVARGRTAPDATDGLVGIAQRAADMVCDVFGRDGIQSVCGHAEVEVALAELGRLTGSVRYINQAALFVERRGTGVLSDIEWGRSYFQDDIPVRDATVLRGHAVRANYLAAGAVDVAVEGHDSELLDALTTQWSNTVAKRTYVTGGQGSRHQDEAFGEDWMLPPDRAYSETCAGIASIMFSWRLLLARGGAQYADLIERTLFNVVATSPSEDGTTFFYANTLHQRRPGTVADSTAVSPRASSSLRAPWFEVSCCPPNVARTLASLGAYFATKNDGGVQIHQYASSTLSTTLADGTAVALSVSTDYPHSGAIAISIDLDAPREWTLSLRVPSWAHRARLVFVAADGTRRVEDLGPGYATLTEQFMAGDRVELDLPMTPRLTSPDPRIDSVRGTVAVERGPEVYCLESTDAAAAGFVGVDDDLASVEFASDPTVTERNGILLAHMRIRPHDTPRWPYDTAGQDMSESETADEAVAIPLIPYRSWAQRGPSTMRVWLPLATRP
jgi:DUF1680 family protein